MTRESALYRATMFVNMVALAANVAGIIWIVALMVLQ